jgi:hypothetical protein
MAGSKRGPLLRMDDPRTSQRRAARGTRRVLEPRANSGPSFRARKRNPSDPTGNRHSPGVIRLVRRMDWGEWALEWTLPRSIHVSFQSRPWRFCLETLLLSFGPLEFWPIQLQQQPRQAPKTNAARDPAFTFRVLCATEITDCGFARSHDDDSFLV